MPVTISIFIESGKILKNDSIVVRYNRSNEYDNLNDRFARFILEEILPEVEKKTTSKGEPIRVSKKATDHAIGGASSGAICAFTAAWQRPDAFSRVYSSIGTYVGMRGGDQYPVLIRKTEPKPIRIFLQDTDKDTWNPMFGNWYDANVAMEAALTFAGYEVTHRWGKGGHDLDHATEVFPQAMRWLWEGWPQPVKMGKSNNDMLQQIILPNEAWQNVNLPFTISGNITARHTGEILISDSIGHLYAIQGKEDPIQLTKQPIPHNYIATSKHALHLIDDAGQLISPTNEKRKKTSVKNLSIEQAAIISTGDMYIICRTNTSAKKLMLLRSDGILEHLNEDQQHGSTLTISPDKNQLLISKKNSNWIYSYTIKSDGTLSNKQTLYWLHNIGADDFGEIKSMAMDNEGNLYVATTFGIQVCDQNGRVRAILSFPQGAVDQLCFGGQNFDTLYSVVRGRLYKRKLNVSGNHSWFAPIKVRSQGGG